MSLTTLCIKVYACAKYEVDLSMTRWSALHTYTFMIRSCSIIYGLYQENIVLTLLTLPLPISHLCENYLPLPNLHLCEIHMCTCNNYNGDISLHAWLKITNQNGQ